jgi:hypothetical protein
VESINEKISLTSIGFVDVESNDSELEGGAVGGFFRHGNWVVHIVFGGEGHGVVLLFVVARGCGIAGKEPGREGPVMSISSRKSCWPVRPRGMELELVVLLFLWGRAGERGLWLRAGEVVLLFLLAVCYLHPSPSSS